MGGGGGGGGPKVPPPPWAMVPPYPNLQSLKLLSPTMQRGGRGVQVDAIAQGGGGCEGKEGVGVRGRRWSMGAQVLGVPGVPGSPLSPGNPLLPDRPIGPGWPSVPFRPGVPDGPGEEEGKGGRGREDSCMFHKIYPPYFHDFILSCTRLYYLLYASAMCTCRCTLLYCATSLLGVFQSFPSLNYYTTCSSRCPAPPQTHKCT